MAELEILSPRQQIDAPICLEACAGAGKTFTIEHLVVRLLCHPQPDKRRKLDEIAVITFTRAAASDLRRRLEQCISSILTALRVGGPLPEYLADRVEQERSSLQRMLELALFSFDRAWVGTIHSFCSRLLRKFGTGLSDLVRASQDQQLPAAVEQEWILEFLRYGLSQDQVGRGQWICLARHFKGGIKLAEALRQHERRAQPCAPWTEVRQQLKAALLRAPCRHLEELHHAWLAMAPGYRGLADRQGLIHAHWIERSRLFAQWVANPTDEHCDLLVQEGCPWLEPFCASRRKTRVGGWVPESKGLALLDWAQRDLEPILQRARSPSRLLALIHQSLSPLYVRWLAEAGCTQPDVLIARVRTCAQSPEWCGKVAEELRTLIVDEFQDTDPDQWAIFSALQPFLQLVLVGDPKQSIYAFRQADLYTYLAAAQAFSEQQRWTLTRCYRSSLPVIAAINCTMEALEGMDLPRLKSFLHVPQTQPRSDPPHPLPLPGMRMALFEQGKSRGKWPSKRLLESDILPGMIEQIFAVHDLGTPWERMAIIVRDRYQAAQVADALSRRGIPSHTARGRSWNERRALPLLRDLIETLCQPEEEGPLLRLLASPLAGWGPEALRAWRSQPILSLIREDMVRMQALLMREGLMAAIHALSQARWSIGPRSTQSQLEWTDLMADLLLLGESLSSLEQKTRSLGLLWSWTLQEVMAGRVLLPEEAAPAPAEAVQIMTIHMSKGLEFDAVFALGISSRTPPPAQEDPAEVDAEKLRQLYVALTRAKRFLWMPVVIDTSGKGPKPGECAPSELLLARLLARSQAQARAPLQEELALLGHGGREIVEAWIAGLPAGAIELQSLAAKGQELRTYSPAPPTQAEPSRTTDWPIARTWSSFTAEARRAGAPPAPTTSGLGQMQSASWIAQIPSSAEFGSAWHSWMAQRLDRHEPLALAFLRAALQRFFPLESDIDALAQQLQQLVEDCMRLPFFRHQSLQEVSLDHRRAEVPFLLADRSGALLGWRGSLDVVAQFGEELVAIDWKTHDLGPRAEDYSPDRMLSCLDHGDYRLQAKLYLAAMRAAGWRTTLGPAKHFVFVFVRGVALGAPAWVHLTEDELYGR
jgi:exodeoxyribonuclease V beta subunit